MNLKLSIHLITYNHELFIEQAIKSILMQEVNFSYEILIGDDCSSDKTRDIVQYYANLYPDKIRALLHQKNLGKNGERNFIETLKACKGEYISFLEGDDYWTHRKKLQIQIDYLENNKDVVGCFHNAITIDAAGNMIRPEWYIGYKNKPQKNNLRFNQLECLSELRSSYPSCSLVIRSESIRHLPAWLLKSPTDFAMDLLITQKGDLAYLNLNMAAYRIHPGGIWQKKSEIEKYIEIFYRLNLLYNTNAFRKKYSSLLRKLINWRINSILIIAKKNKIKLDYKFLIFAYRYTYKLKRYYNMLILQAKLRLSNRAP